jgi:murein DD-endopeptidase MepM/ murein hydrolase activator NlpD
VLKNLGYIFIFILSLTLSSYTSFVENNPDNEVIICNEEIKDTIPAFVMYGSRFLLDSLENFDEASIIEFRDSLKCFIDKPVSLINYIDLYLDIHNMSRLETVNLIDSLFEADEVPYPLINQINLYVASDPTFPEDIVVTIDTSFYPANEYYKNHWNIDVPHPYSANMSKNDTVIKLVLNGRGKSNGFVMPVENVLTSKFGWRDGRPHKGIDIDLEVWDSVLTAFPGKVRVAKYYGGYGRVVVVRHYNGLETLYAHLHRFKVQTGDTLEAGDVVGLGGSSGHSTGSHLHFETRFKGIPINPLAFINYKEQNLVSDTLILKKTQYGYAAYPEGTKFYEVKAGDNLYEIAKAFGTTTYKLAEINGIQRNRILIVGQTLRVI